MARWLVGWSKNNEFVADIWLVGVKTQGIGFVANRLPVRALDEPIIPKFVICRCASFWYAQKYENTQNPVTNSKYGFEVVGVEQIIIPNAF